ncbi:hypothetical protein [uncultured Mucilaginibacter sp.]|uniref:hypothetical protein n=1 Tax=uncultured Mucilaginibacter sp. TaxID=797541 RepID=UPI0025DD73D2|nr:hypothetical protein [uncultured Mucilaginibacter sp.]
METLQHDQLINRINNLNTQSKPRYGKISLSQMLAHCIAMLQVTAAHQFSPESFADQILKAITNNALSKKPSIDDEKLKLVDCINQHTDNADAGIYKHIDRHLQQFSV